MSMVPTEPGDYEVVTGRNYETGDPIVERFSNVTFSYGQSEDLQVMRGGLLVATFRWWDSIRLVEA